MNLASVFLALLVLFIEMGIGAVGRKVKILSEDFPKAVNPLIFNITMPCMLLSSLSTSVTKEIVFSSGKVFLVTILCIVVPHLLSIPYTKLLKLPPKKAAVHWFTFVFSNSAFMGIAVTNAIWGDKYVFPTVLFILIGSIYMATFGAVVMSGSAKINWKEIFLNPMLLASILGLVLGIAGIKLPTFLANLLNTLGMMTTPLAMFLIGFILSGMSFKKIVGNKNVLLTTFIRLIVFPFLTYFVLKPFSGGAPELYMVPAVIMAMPTITLLSVLAHQYGADVEEGSCLVAATSFCSLFTIPLFVWFMLR